QRTPALSLMRAGQELTRGLRMPPKCEATCLPHWKGVFIAQAHPTGKWLYEVGPPISSRCRITYDVSSFCPFNEDISLKTPYRVPSNEAPLSPISQITSVLSVWPTSSTAARTRPTS